LHAGGQRFDPA